MSAGHEDEPALVAPADEEADDLYGAAGSAEPAAAPDAPRGALEIATIEVSRGAEQEFLAAYRTGRGALISTAGCHSVRMTRGVESPSRFVLLVEWDSVHAHEQNFRATDRFTRWRGLLDPHFAAPPHVEHYVDVDD